jgi:hypothetical protein
VQRYLDALLFAPRHLDIGDEQESHNQDADISAVQVLDIYRRLIVPSCRHDSAPNSPLPEDLGNWYQQYFHLDHSCALDCDKWVMQSLLLVSLLSSFLANSHLLSPGMVAAAVAAVDVLDAL